MSETTPSQILKQAANNMFRRIFRKVTGLPTLKADRATATAPTEVSHTGEKARSEKDWPARSDGSLSGLGKEVLGFMPRANETEQDYKDRRQSRPPVAPQERAQLVAEEQAHLAAEGQQNND